MSVNLRTSRVLYGTDDVNMLFRSRITGFRSRIPGSRCRGSYVAVRAVVVDVSNFVCVAG